MESCQALAHSPDDALDVGEGGVGVGGAGDENHRNMFDFGTANNDFQQTLAERKRRKEAAVGVALERTRMLLATPEGQEELLKESFLHNVAEGGMAEAAVRRRRRRRRRCCCGCCSYCCCF